MAISIRKCLPYLAYTKSYTVLNVHPSMAFHGIADILLKTCWNREGKTCCVVVGCQGSISLHISMCESILSNVGYSRVHNEFYQLRIRFYKGANPKNYLACFARQNILIFLLAVGSTKKKLYPHSGPHISLIWMGTIFVQISGREERWRLFFLRTQIWAFFRIFFRFFSFF